MTGNHAIVARSFEAVVMPHIKARRLEMLLAFEANGVPAVHGLNAAVQAGIHEVVAWYLERKIEPNADTFEHAIRRGKKAIATILPYVKPNSEHVAVCVNARRPEVLRYLLQDLKVPASRKVFQQFFAYRYLPKEAAQCVDELLRANATAHAGSYSLIYMMHMLGGAQVGRAIDQAPHRYDCRKVYSIALFAGNASAIAELRERAPLTPRVALRAVMDSKYSKKYLGYLGGGRQDDRINTVLREAHSRGVTSFPTRMMRGACVKSLQSLWREATHVLHASALSGRHPVEIHPRYAESVRLALALVEPNDRAVVISELESSVSELCSKPFSYPAENVGQLSTRRDQILRECLQTAVAALDAEAAYHTASAPGL